LAKKLNTIEDQKDTEAEKARPRPKTSCNKKRINRSIAKVVAPTKR